MRLEDYYGRIFSRLLSVGSDKELREFEQITQHVNDLGPTFEAMSDEELSGQTELFRERLANGESLDDLLPEAFAAVREASARTTGMRHFDVQIIGGIALHRGMIAEMKQAKVRHWFRPSQVISMPLMAKAFISSR